MRNYLVVLATVLFLGACSSSPVTTDFDNTVDFTGYKTYAFISDSPLMRAPDTPPGSPLLQGRLMKATDAILMAKGYSKVDDPETADFTVAFTVGARDKVQVNSYPEPYRPYYGAWGWGAPYYAGVGAQSVDVRQYTEGTLAIDVFDVAEHKPAWHGVAKGRITDKMRENPSEAVNTTVSEVLLQFPPGSATP